MLVKSCWELLPVLEPECVFSLEISMVMRPCGRRARKCSPLQPRPHLPSETVRPRSLEMRQLAGEWGESTLLLLVQASMEV